MDTIGSLWNNYVDAIANYRAGQAHDDPVYLGKAKRAEAEKFAERKDRRYQIMLLPAESGQVTVWLTGDPTVVHARTADFIAKKFFGAAFDLKYDFTTRFSIAEVFHHNVRDDRDANHRVFVRFNGQVAKKEFQTGWANKEADSLLSYLETVSRMGQDTLAIEVAYKHEGPKCLLFEGALWSQQGSASKPVVNPMNFIGAHVEEGQTFMYDPSLRACWALLVMGAADQDGRGTADLYLLNATDAYEQKWKTALRDSSTAPVKVVRATEVHLQYALGCPFLPPSLMNATFSITPQDLSNEHIVALEKEQRHAEMSSM
ncbi:unnamed protein product [Sympodiomycopsis kandeliae]